MLNRGGIADLPLLRTLFAIRQMSWEPSLWEVTDSFVFLTYASLAASRTLLQWLLSFLNFSLESDDLSFWNNRKKWFLWTMDAAQAAENYGDEWGLTWYFLWWIYTSIPTWTHAQDSLAAAEAPGLRKNSFLYLLRHSVTVIKFIKWKKHFDGWGNGIKL